MIESIVHKSELRPMMRTIEFVYYLFWIGVLIGALHLADVRPWAERMAPFIRTTEASACVGRRGGRLASSLRGSTRSVARGILQSLSARSWAARDVVTVDEVANS